MVRQICSELTELIGKSILLIKRRVQILFQTRKRDKVTQGIIPKFLPYYVNIPKLINAEIETFFIDIYVTDYVLSCYHISHFLASILTEIPKFTRVPNLFYGFSDGLHFDFIRR
jgi:hypothetical protein